MNIFRTLIFSLVAISMLGAQLSFAGAPGDDLPPVSKKKKVIIIIKQTK